MHLNFALDIFNFDLWIYLVVAPKSTTQWRWNGNGVLGEAYKFSTHSYNFGHFCMKFRKLAHNYMAHAGRKLVPFPYQICFSLRDIDFRCEKCNTQHLFIKITFIRLNLKIKYSYRYVLWVVVLEDCRLMCCRCAFNDWYLNKGLKRCVSATSRSSTPPDSDLKASRPGSTKFLGEVSRLTFACSSSEDLKISPSLTIFVS